MITVRVLYFAILRRERGLSGEEVSTAAATPLGLYEELKRRHGLTPAPSALRVAVNEEFRDDWNSALKDGDTVVFVTPVAGG